MKLCPKCGKEIQEQAIFCKHCHTRLDEYKQRCEELQYFVNAIEKLEKTPREDYEKEIDRIKECLEVLKSEIDVSFAQKKLERAKEIQKEWQFEKIYQIILPQLETNDMEKLYDLYQKFSELGKYKDAEKYKKICGDKIAKYEAEEKIKYQEKEYQKALARMQEDTSESYIDAMSIFSTIIDYKDSEDKQEVCRIKLSEFRLEEEKAKQELEKIEGAKKEELLRKQKQRTKKIVGISIVIVGAFLLFGIIYWIMQRNKYFEAMSQKNAGEYEQAKELFEELGEYKDSKQLIDICEKELKYEQAMLHKKNGNYVNAIAVFEEIMEYSDCIEQIEECQYLLGLMHQTNEEYEKAIEIFTMLGKEEDIFACIYDIAMEYSELGNYIAALEELEKIKDYADSTSKIEEVKQRMYEEAEKCLYTKKYEVAIEWYSILGKYQDSIEKIKQCEYEIAKEYLETENYKEALERFQNIEEYSDSKDKIKKCKYEIACDYMENSNYEKAISIFEEIKEYTNTATLLQQCKYEMAILYKNSGNYSEAIKIFSSLGTYSDSIEQIEECNWATMKEGDIIYFGKYEQDNNSYTKNEEIEWIVLEVNNGQALLLSRYVLDCNEYGSIYSGKTWESCAIREWLNQDFYVNAFNTEEKSRIVTSTITTIWGDFWEDFEENTKDKIFLLSGEEVQWYCSIYEELGMVTPTAYAKAKGVATPTWLNEKRYPQYYYNCYRWCRTPAWSLGYDVEYVNYEGTLLFADGAYDEKCYGIRPVMWVDIN